MPEFKITHVIFLLHNITSEHASTIAGFAVIHPVGNIDSNLDLSLFFRRNLPSHFQMTIYPDGSDDINVEYVKAKFVYTGTNRNWPKTAIYETAWSWKNQDSHWTSPRLTFNLWLKNPGWF